MRIFLSGASGMVGQNILEQPEAKKYQWLTPTHSELDLRNKNDVLLFFENSKPDFVVHAAGIVGGIQANMREPVRFFIDNLDIGRNVIMGAHQLGVEKLLNLSCSCMYPRATALPMKENSILTGELEPTNEGYALARIAAQRLCEYISKENSRFQYKTLISSNLYGRFDKFDPKHAHMIPSVLVKLHQAKIAKAKQVDIWGDGTATREFMYAGDLANCVFKAIDRFDTLPALSNVGPGLEVSINSYYEIISKIIGFNGAFIHDLTKPSGMARKVVDTTRLDEWGWKPSTSLEAGLSATYKFYLDQEKTL